ncbi:MAG: cytochrome c oxidase subunit II [Alphaproteobacteria bacterium]
MATQAQEVVGVAQPWQKGFQDAASPIMERVIAFHDGFLLPLTAIILAFVLALLIYVMVRFNARANPTPSRTTHNTFLEIIWTVVPVLILVAIAVPSFRLLYFQRTIPDADITLKVIGNQWYWTYEYPDYDDLTFDAVMLEDDELQPGQLRLLDVDNQVVVPVGKTVKLLLTATDVIHAWAIPALGVKIDTIPGRLNEAWFKAEKIGIYYGQCSELCGVRHAFMPIALRVVSEADFAKWLETAKVEFAQGPRRAPGAGPAPKLAARNQPPQPALVARVAQN